MKQPWEYPVTKEVLADREFSSARLDAGKRWRQAYDIYFMNIRTKRGKSGKRPLLPAASVDMVFSPGDEQVNLTISYTAQMLGDKSVTRSVCRNNSLLSPVSWTQTFTNKTKSGQGLVDLAKKGTVVNGVFSIDGRQPTVSWPLRNYTADWCLPAVVQRLAAEDSPRTEAFDLLEEFSILRGGQKLIPRGVAKVETRGGEITAQVFCHFGEAVIPTLYYVDEASHRLVLALSTRRTIVLRKEVS